MQKFELRQLAKQRRRLMPQQTRADQSKSIFNLLRLLPEFQTSQIVAIYQSWDSEPSTDAICNALIDRGAYILLPASGTNQAWRTLAGEILPPAALAGADLIITPALAVDFLGTRLGRGAGWYDQMLPHRAADAKIIALLFEGEYQATRLLPKDPHDISVDMVVTPRGAIEWRVSPC